MCHRCAARWFLRVVDSAPKSMNAIISCISCEMLKLTLSVISCIFNFLLPGPLCAAGFARRSWSTDCKSLSEHWTLVWPPDCCRYASNVISPEHVESSSSLIMLSTPLSREKTPSTGSFHISPLRTNVFQEGLLPWACTGWPHSLPSQRLVESPNSSRALSWRF